MMRGDTDIKFGLRPTAKKHHWALVFDAFSEI